LLAAAIAVTAAAPAAAVPAAAAAAAAPAGTAAAVRSWSFGQIPARFDPSESGLATIAIGGQPYVFWYENYAAGNEFIGALAYARYDGTQWRTGLLDGFGKTDVDDVGSYPVAVEYRGEPHLFYANNFPAGGLAIRHAWRTGGGWRFENLPGAGTHFTAAVYRGAVHLWYQGHDASGFTLRHSWHVGSIWHQETLDGIGGPNGRIAADVGSYARAVLDLDRPQVYYYDRTNGNLRQAAWNGTRWQFLSLDGGGGSNGRLGGDIGGHLSVVEDGGSPHVYYYDATRGNLRQARYDRSSQPFTWRFVTLDGLPGPSGRLDADLGTFTSAAPGHVYYYDATHGDLRQAWYETAAAKWRFQTLDGSGGPAGRVSADVGRPTAVAYGGNLVYYRDHSSGSVRFAWWR